MVKRAGTIFQNDTLPVGDGGDMQSPEDYVHQLSTTSGLPYSLIRMNLKRLGGIFGDIEIILRGLTRGMDMSVLDRGYGTQGGAPVSWNCVTDNLAVILPSNSPAVNALWIPSIALGVPVVSVAAKLGTAPLPTQLSAVLIFCVYYSARSLALLDVLARRRPRRR